MPDCLCELGELSNFFDCVYKLGVILPSKQSVCGDWDHGCEHLNMAALQGRAYSSNPSVPRTGHGLLVVWGILGIQPQHGASYPIAHAPRTVTHHCCLPLMQGSVPCDRESAAGEVGAPEAAGFPQVGQHWVRSESMSQTPQVGGPIWLFPVYMLDKHSYWDSTLISLSLTYCSNG